ncbi:MAG: DNA topoisomerase IV subunit B, partial [Clostridiales bacterium]|nr:DNA topoisomerase IV subunit B [Clostridiales bacterium]
MNGRILTLEQHTTSTPAYDGNQIQVLEGLEAVRKRPGMYIGSTGERGLHHLVYEIVDNSVDEALAGFCRDIEVDILPGDIIRVKDDGRGIPVGIQPKMGIPAVTVVFTVLHAGGKFGGSGYKVSGGLHGVGASVVNALSEWLEVEVSNGEHVYAQRFERGNIISDLHIVGDTDKTGTVVTFKPDAEIFKDTTVYQFDILLTRLREQAFLNAGVNIILSDKRDEENIRTKELCYEGGIRSYVEYRNQHKDVIHDDVIYLSAVDGDTTAEIAVQYNDSYEERITSFANNIHTTDGGTHETGFKAAMTRVFNDYGHRFRLLKEDEKLSGEDVREGLTAIISVKLKDAQFEGQTKAKLGNTFIRSIVDSLTYNGLMTYFEENPATARSIFDKALVAAEARERARKAR